MPTFNVWTGNAAGIADVWTLTPANPEVGDVFIVEINNKTVSYTVTDTTNTVATLVPALVAVLASSVIPEFAEITWSSGEDNDGNPTHVIATGPSDGKPVIISSTTADAGNFKVTVTVITAGSPPVNEKQTITLANSPTGGTFTLTCSGTTTGALTYDESAADIETALKAILGASEVDVTGNAGGPWVVEFTGSLAGTNVALLTGNGTNLTGAASIQVYTETQGSTGTNEIQVISFPGVSEDYCNIEWYDPLGGVHFINGISCTATAAQVQTLFDMELFAGQVVVTKPNSLQFFVEFTGAFAGIDVELMVDWGSTANIYEYVKGGSTGALTQNEVQRVAVLNTPTGGTFTLTFDGKTTAAIAYNASAATVETELEALTTIGSGNVAVTWVSTYYKVEFQGALAGTDVSEITGDGTSLTGSAVYVSTTTQPSAGVNEQQQVTQTNYPTGGTFTLTWNPGGGDETTGNINHNASAAEVQTALEGLTTPGPGDFLVTGAAEGPWLVSFMGTYANTNVALMVGDPTNLTGGGAQAYVASHTTTGTGPHHFTDVDNWSAGTAPADDEWVVFENSSVDCLYGLSVATTTPEKLIIKSDFTGSIGLPKHTGEYYEYRATELTIGSTGDGSAATLTVEIGAGDGSGSPLIRLNTGSKQTVLVVRNTGSSSENSAPAVNWRGTHANNAAEIYKGTVGIGAFSGQAATLETLLQGFIDSPESDSTVVIGDQVTLTTVTKLGGTLTCNCGCTTLQNEDGNALLDGSGACSVLYVYGGTVTSNTSGIVGKYGAITGITKANPGVVSSTGHGLATGDKVRIASVVGMTEVNQREFTVEWASADTFNLVSENTSSCGAWSSAGYWAKIGSVVVMGNGVLDFSKELTARQVAPAIDVYGDLAEVIDTAKRLSTVSYLTGEFAVQWHGTTRNANLGKDFIEVRK